MKDKIKNSLLIIAIVYSITILALMLYSYNTSINTIELNDGNENITVLNNYKEKIKNIEESTCKNALTNLIEHYDKTSYNGIVNLKDKYFSEDSVLNYATDIFNNCHLSDNDKNAIALKMLTASIQFDTVVERLLFQYEIRIPDYDNRLLMELSLNEISYNINRKNQLETMALLIDILDKEIKYE